MNLRVWFVANCGFKGQYVSFGALELSQDAWSFPRYRIRNGAQFFTFFSTQSFHSTENFVDSALKCSRQCASLYSQRSSLMSH